LTRMQEKECLCMLAYWVMICQVLRVFPNSLYTLMWTRSIQLKYVLTRQSEIPGNVSTMHAPTYDTNALKKVLKVEVCHS
jgi:hypothetical protein